MVKQGSLQGMVRYDLGARRAGKLTSLGEQWEQRMVVLQVEAAERLCGVRVEIADDWRAAYVDPSVPLGVVRETTL